MGVCLEKPDLCIITEFLERGSLFEILVEPSYFIEEEHVRGVCETLFQPRIADGDEGRVEAGGRSM
jgi:hypothetical protein